MAIANGHRLGLECLQQRRCRDGSAVDRRGAAVASARIRRQLLKMHALWRSVRAIKGSLSKLDRGACRLFESCDCILSGPARRVIPVHQITTPVRNV